MPVGAPKGSRNAAKGREWRDAIRYALAKRGRDIDGDDAAYTKGLRKVAEKFVEAAENGDAWAMKELGDRFDGKPTQAIDLDGEVNFPLSGTVRFVKCSESAD